VRDFARWRDLAATTSPAELVRAVMDESGYTAMLQAERSTEAAGRLENLSELVRALEDYETLGDFLEHVSLVMDNDNADDAEKVTIMTIHAAKGLEFDQLFLPGWEEGVFPSQRAMDEGGLASLEEERRLAYVAITRARRRCTILHAANRRIYGQWTSSIPSRFVNEIPAEHVSSENSMAGGASLWRAQWSERDDPFAHVAATQPSRITTRGPGWQRAAQAGAYDPAPRRIAEPTRSAASFAAKPRADLRLGDRVFHEKFGAGTIAVQDGNKLEIDFDNAGRKRVIDSFVKPA
jgi:DNA helicase-2/ATP-dependent DNA helicase PcrA